MTFKTLTFVEKTCVLNGQNIDKIQNDFFPKKIEYLTIMNSLKFFKNSLRVFTPKRSFTQFKVANMINTRCRTLNVTFFPRTSVPETCTEKKCLCIEANKLLKKIRSNIDNLEREYQEIDMRQIHYISKLKMPTHFSNLFNKTAFMLEESKKKYDTKNPVEIVNSYNILSELLEKLEKESGQILYVHYDEDYRGKD